MDALKATPVFLALLFTGCVHKTQPVAPPQPSDPCFHAMEICEETRVNLALINSTENVERVKITESSRLFVVALKAATEAKDWATVAKLNGMIVDHLDSSDPAVRKSQQDALGEAGLNEKDIRSKVIKCDEVPSKDGGMTLHCN